MAYFNLFADSISLLTHVNGRLAILQCVKSTKVVMVGSIPETWTELPTPVIWAPYMGR